METVAEIKALVEGHREQQQIDRELSIIDNRINRTYEALRDVASLGGASILNQYSNDMYAAVVNAQHKLVSGDASMTTYNLRILALQPEQVVAVIYQCVMDLAARDENDVVAFSAPANTFYRRIGSLVEVTARLNMMNYVRKGSKKPQDNTPLIALAKEYNVEASRISKWKSKQLPACMRDTKDVDLISTGKVIWDLVEETLQSVVYMRKVGTGGNNMQYRVGIIESVAQIMEEEALDRAVLDAALGFMVCPPNALTADSVNIRERYLTELVSRKDKLKIEPSEITLRAANTTQGTAYSINQDVFQLFMTLNDDICEKLAGLQDVPSEANDGESVRQFEARVHNVKVSNTAKLNAIQGLKIAATEASQYARVWFPAYLDFRGRLYTVDYRGLGPQSNKNAKALLQLSQGSPLGSNGLWWLYHELGNSMGWDKDLLEDKVAKAKALLPRMRGIVANPLSDTVWLEGDDPLKVYACMVDITRALDSGKPESFVSHLICYVDGSCNGMQHLSLMTNDEVGAAATNVICPDGKRSDFYSVVGNRMLDALEDQYSEAAMYWKTTASEKYGMRKIAKRGVMTIPYGATHGGLAQQFVEDGFCTTKEFSHKGTQAESFVIRDALEIAMDGAAPRAMALREWMLEAISAVCKNGVSPQWVVPTGTTVKHYYVKNKTKRVRIADTMTSLPDYTGKGATVDAKKNRSSIVANLIHSFDAAMLQDTAVRMLDQGVEELSFVHDSYGAGAGHMDSLSVTLRESAFDMYSVDQVAAIHADFERQAGREITAPPTRGNLDLTDVKSAPYFFA